MTALSPLFGMVVGFSLGLTGGGGSIFAVPLLVYGLSIAPREAIGISLAAVGATAFVGAVQRGLAGDVDLRIGLWFAAAGMLGAPMGSWLSADIPEPALLLLFACLMAFVAQRMWRLASAEQLDVPDHKTRKQMKHLSRRALMLVLTGLLTGVLSGMLGVGGGFLIVPALVLASGMTIHRAVSTSLIVIALVSTSGVMAYIAAGRPLELTLASLFVLGGVAGMGVGTQLSRKLSGPILQKSFAFVMALVAVFIIAKSVA